jgi:hypothetical protein
MHLLGTPLHHCTCAREVATVARKTKEETVWVFSMDA